MDIDKLKLQLYEINSTTGRIILPSQELRQSQSVLRPLPMLHDSSSAHIRQAEHDQVLPPISPPISGPAPMWFYVGLLAMGIACVIMGVLIASLKAEQGSLIEKTARLEAQAKAVRQEMDKKIASMGSTSNNVTGILKSLETLNALVLSHNRQIAAVQSEVERLRYDLEEATKPPPEQ